jgi:hypothetical protein
MRSRTTNSLTLLSSLLCLAVLGTWVLGHWRAGGIVAGHGRVVYQLWYVRSGLYCGRLGGITAPAPLHLHWFSAPAADAVAILPPRERWKVGFNAASFPVLPSSGYTSFRAVLVPFWAPAAAFAALPATRLARRLRRRNKAGRGFEVRGTDSK